MEILQPSFRNHLILVCIVCSNLPVRIFGRSWSYLFAGCAIFQDFLLSTYFCQSKRFEKIFKEYQCVNQFGTSLDPNSLLLLGNQ